MDAQKMSFADESFDYIVASLILSVVHHELADCCLSN